jgi:hypothetical protein
MLVAATLGLALTAPALAASAGHAGMGGNHNAAAGRTMGGGPIFHVPPSGVLTHGGDYPDQDNRKFRRCGMQRGSGRQPQACPSN